MVVQRGLSSWEMSSADVQQSQQQASHLLNPPIEFENNRSTSVLDESSNNSSVLKCNGIKQEEDSLAYKDLLEWKNTFNMRQINLNNLTSSQMALNSTFKANIAVSRLRGRCISSTAKSLDLLRQNLQSVINKEIDVIIKKYLEKFFQPAMDNIRINLGSSAVNEDHIRDLCKQILEEAKQMYCSGSFSRSSSPYNELSDSETGSIGEYKFGRPHSRSPMLRKRKESDTDSEASQSVRRKRSKPRCPGLMQSNLAATLKARSEPVRREAHKWDPNRIVPETLFIMGARANKVLGFGQTRGRLYIKHPGMVRYSGDQEDKEWLAKHNLMPPTGGKAYLMILEDIRELAETDEYRNNPNLLLHELKGFEAPDFMLKKIRAFVSNMRTDIIENKKLTQADICDVPDTNFLMMQGRLGFGLDIVSAAMTPPATVLDSGPPTPCETLDLLDCPSITSLVSQNSDMVASYLGSMHQQQQQHAQHQHHQQQVQQQQQQQQQHQTQQMQQHQLLTGNYNELQPDLSAISSLQQQSDATFNSLVTTFAQAADASTTLSALLASHPLIGGGGDSSQEGLP